MNRTRVGIHGDVCMKLGFSVFKFILFILGCLNKIH